MTILSPDSQGPSEKRRKYGADLERLGYRRTTVLQECEGMEYSINASKRRLRKILSELQGPLSEEDRIRLSQEKSLLEDRLEIKKQELRRLRETLYEVSTEIDQVHLQYQESIGVISKGDVTKATKLQWFFEWQVSNLQEEMENNESIGGWRDSTPATRLSVDDAPEYTTFSR